MGKPSKRKYLQAFLQRALEIQRNSDHPESFYELVIWAQRQIEKLPPPKSAKKSKS